MHFFNRLSSTFPVILSLAMVVLWIVLSQVSAMLLAGTVPDASPGELSVYTRYACCVLIVFLLGKLGGLNASGVSSLPSQWHKRWLLASLPLSVIVVLNLSVVEWSNLTLNLGALPAYLFTHLASGLFEELLLRGLVFFILVRAWSDKSNGILKAAIVQAVIFGALHLLNLLNGAGPDEVVRTLVQVVYATAIGISFAGVAAYGRTIWSVVIWHTLINAAGSINRTFVPDYVDTPPSLVLYLVFIVIIVVCTTVPALYLLRRTDTHGDVYVKSASVAAH